MATASASAALTVGGLTTLLLAAWALRLRLERALHAARSSESAK